MSHSVYSFSSSHRWMNCPASIRMSKGYPNSTNPASELGTAVHELGEFCIAIGINPSRCLGLTFNDHVTDDKMIEGASLYKNVVDDLTTRYGVSPLLEERVTMSSLGRDDVYGTSDVTHIALHKRILHTTDYKNGYGVVEVKDNSQTAGYSVATLDTFNLWDKVDEVHNTIIQPNYEHINGPIRTEVYTMDDMVKWRENFRVAVLRADDPNEQPVAGDWCHYCPAQANCRPRMLDVLDKAYTTTGIHNISIGELEVIYKHTRSIQRFLEMVGGRILEEARKGAEYKHYKLVKSYPWAVVEDVEGLLVEVKKLGIDETKMYNNPKLIGKTKAKKLLPKPIIEKFYRTPPASSTVVENSNNRPAMRVGKASGVFTPVNQPRPDVSGIFAPVK